MAINEGKFVEDLAQTPELPPELYGRILHGIHRAAVIRRTVLSTVLVALIVSAGSLLAVRQHQIAQNERSELASELESIQSFVNGDNIEQEYAQYALVDYSD